MNSNLQRTITVAATGLTLGQPIIFQQAAENFDLTYNHFKKTPGSLPEDILVSIEQLNLNLQSISQVFLFEKKSPNIREVKDFINLSEDIRTKLVNFETTQKAIFAQEQSRWMEAQVQENWLRKSVQIFVSLLLIILTWASFEREKSDKMVRASESLYKLLFASLSEGVILCLRDGTITFANDRIGQLFKLNPKKLVGRKFSDLMASFRQKDGTLYAFGESPIEVACRSQSPVESMEMGVESMNGDVQWFSVNSQPVFDATISNSVSAVISLSDISKTVESQQTILDQQIQIAQTAKMAALGEMAGGMAHEINNPLAIIQTKADELEDIAEDEKQVSAEDAQAMAVQIRKTVGRIAKIIRGLRTFSREGSADPYAHVLVKSLFEDTLEIVKPRLKELGIEFKIEDYPEDLALNCRATQIEQVLVNMINNSRDAIEKLEDRWITVQVAQSIDKVKISVTDCGTGIPKKVQEKIFQPFFTTKAVGKGTGLGMSISKGIIDDHGGQLYIDNNSKNTRFVIELPVSKPESGSIPDSSNKVA